MVHLFGLEFLLVLSFPAALGQQIAERLLADAHGEVDKELMCDCLAELANSIASQAKTLLHGTPYPFVFSTPAVIRGTGQPVAPGADRECLVAGCGCGLGAFCSCS